MLAGAERADVLIDFSDCAGQSFILYNDALSPFPDGDDADYYTGSPIRRARWDSTRRSEHPHPDAHQDRAPGPAATTDTA